MKSGAKEAEVRKKFSSILKSYGLGGNWEAEGGTSADQADLSKTIFKDKASRVPVLLTKSSGSRSAQIPHYLFGPKDVDPPIIHKHRI